MVSRACLAHTRAISAKSSVAAMVCKLTNAILVPVLYYRPQPFFAGVCGGPLLLSFGIGPRSGRAFANASANARAHSSVSSQRRGSPLGFGGFIIAAECVAFQAAGGPRGRDVYRRGESGTC